MEGMQRAGPLHPSLTFSSVFVFKKLVLVYYVEITISHAFNFVLYGVSSVLRPGLHKDDDDDEYNSMF
jgi:hypothetical protein